MIASHSKTEDMKARADMLECMEICLRNGLTDVAKSIGESSVSLKKRIDSHDYSLEDAWTAYELYLSNAHTRVGPTKTWAEFKEEKLPTVENKAI